ncbi:MAG: DNA repair protein RecO [Planctomycetota bacterium]
MSSEKTQAIVVRVVDFSETSCVVTLFTREFGKIGALAKGARRPKSPFESALDLLAVCRIVFLHKSSESLDVLTEAKLERRFRGATRDLSRLYAGYYIAELLRDLTHAGDPLPALYDAAEAGLQELEGNLPVHRIVLRFEMLALHLLGHLPALFGCAACGQSIEVSGRMLFGQQAGGLLCSRCRVGQRQVVGTTARTIEVLRRFATFGTSSWRETPMEARTRGEIRGIVGQYMCNVLDHRPRMHDYLGSLSGNVAPRAGHRDTSRERTYTGRG